MFKMLVHWLRHREDDLIIPDVTVCEDTDEMAGLKATLQRAVAARSTLEQNLADMKAFTERLNVFYTKESGQR
jgi:hypothetical protein